MPDMKHLLSFLYVMIVGAGWVFAQSTASADSSSVAMPETNIGQIKDLISMGKIIYSILVLGGTYLFNRIVVFLLGALAERQSSYRLVIKRLVPFLNVFVWSFAIFVVIAGIISPPIETVLAVGASIGIAIGFASQDILKNIFGGFIIILDRPFQVGDKIEVNSHYGEVMEIGLRSTRIVTPDDSVVSIPNADIVSNSVSNTNSGALDCQVVIEVFLPAKTDIDQVKDIAFKAAISSRYVYLKKPIVVMTANQVHEQNYVMVCKVKAYVLDIRYEFLLKSDITELIMRELSARDLIPEYQLS
jgi:small-conductance mechanosensitive channel